MCETGTFGSLKSKIRDTQLMYPSQSLKLGRVYQIHDQSFRRAGAIQDYFLMNRIQVASLVMHHVSSILRLETSLVDREQAFHPLYTQRPVSSWIEGQTKWCRQKSGATTHAAF